MVTVKITPWNHEYTCKSTDNKPIIYKSPTGAELDIPNGSTLYEMDTKKVYMWDLDGHEWLPQ